MHDLLMKALGPKCRSCAYTSLEDTTHPTETESEGREHRHVVGLGVANSLGCRKPMRGTWTAKQAERREASKGRTTMVHMLEDCVTRETSVD
eukprot:117050-Amphidinium_carterae.1